MLIFTFSGALVLPCSLWDSSRCCPLRDVRFGPWGGLGRCGDEDLPSIDNNQTNQDSAAIIPIQFAHSRFCVQFCDHPPRWGSAISTPSAKRRHCRFAPWWAPPRQYQVPPASFPTAMRGMSRSPIRSSSRARRLLSISSRWGWRWLWSCTSGPSSLRSVRWKSPIWVDVSVFNVGRCTVL